MSTALAEATLPRSREIAQLRAAIETATGRQASELRTDLHWALLDVADEIAADAEARERARALARAGDQDARQALRLAREHGRAPEPLSAGTLFTREPDGLAATARLPLLAELRGLLAEHRRQGSSFALAWTISRGELGLATGPAASVLNCTRPAWKAAYEREVPPAGFGLVEYDA